MSDLLQNNAVKYFGLYVNMLIDQGYVEVLEVIEKKMEEKKLVEYIGQKYKELVDFTPFDQNGPYSISDLNEKFNDFIPYVLGNEDRKFLVSKNGLNLIMALSLEIIANNK